MLVETAARNDLRTLFGKNIPPPEQASHEELYLYTMLVYAGMVAVRRAVQSDSPPSTPIGKVANDISCATANRCIRQSSDLGGCWEAEPRLLRSLEKVADYAHPRHVPAVVFVAPSGTIVGFEKHNGVGSTFITHPHPYFGNLPAGCIVDDQIIGRPMDDTLKRTANPALRVKLVPEDCDTPPVLIRPSVFMVSPEIRQAWKYDITTVLANDEHDGLVPYAREAASMTLEQCIATVHDAVTPAL